MRVYFDKFLLQSNGQCPLECPLYGVDDLSTASASEPEDDTQLEDIINVIIGK